MLLLQETVAESCGRREILQKGLGFNVDFRVNQEIISSKTDISNFRKNRMRDSSSQRNRSSSLGRNCASNKSISSSSNSGRAKDSNNITQPPPCAQPEEQARPRTIAGRPQDESLPGFFSSAFFWSSIGTRLTINKVLLTSWLFTLAFLPGWSSVRRHSLGKS